MQWSNFFSRPAELTTSEVKEYLDTHSPDEFQLVDVRQEKEYRGSHLPGALLLPLGELESRFGELDASQKTIVYCRSGARSSTACQFLEQRGFAKVFNMKGGILAWQGQRAIGGEEDGLGYFLAGDYSSIYEMSCNLEAGLQRFYQLLGQQAADAGQNEVATFLARMAEFEDGHIGRLTALHNREYPDTPLQVDGRLLEGGFSFENLLTTFGANLDSAASVLQLAMSFEAQAQDFYFRLERRASEQSQKQFFAQMMSEERTHLQLLATEFEKVAGEDVPLKF